MKVPFLSFRVCLGPDWRPLYFTWGSSRPGPSNAPRCPQDEVGAPQPCPQGPDDQLPSFSD